MTIVNGRTYRFINVYRKGYGLNIYGTGASDIKGGQNVCLYSESPTDSMQQWEIEERGSNGYRLHAVPKPSYVLDCSDGSISTSYKNNAHMCAETGTTDVDCAVEFEYVGSNQVRIHLGQKGLCLTATTVAESDAELSNNISTSAALRGGSEGRGNVYWKTPADEGSMTWKKQCWEVIEVGGGTDPEPEPGEYDKNYLIYPTKTMNITQNTIDGNHYYCSQEAPADYPIDEACEDTGRSWFYCPCDEMVVTRVYTSGTNAIWFESTSPVVTPSGTYSKISMMVMHPEDEDLTGLDGRIFTRGQAMFREGMDGAPKGNHFHISVGTGSYNGGKWENGWFGPKSDKEQFSFTPTGKTLRPEDAFFVDPTFTTIVNPKGITFKMIYKN